MKHTVFILIALLSLQPAHAESVRERLRKAREAETAARQPKPVVEVLPTNPLADKEKQPVCSEEAKVAQEISYYNECYCKKIQYPALDQLFKGKGIVYHSQGMRELGNGVTHLDPKEREKQFYTCGVELGWDPKEAPVFKNVKSCNEFIHKTVRDIGKTPEFIDTPLYYGCGKLAQPVEKKTTP